jgi:hypothetical protein
MFLESVYKLAEGLFSNFFDLTTGLTFWVFEKPIFFFFCMVFDFLEL